MALHSTWVDVGEMKSRHWKMNTYIFKFKFGREYQYLSNHDTLIIFSGLWLTGINNVCGLCIYRSHFTILHPLNGFWTLINEAVFSLYFSEVWF